MISWTISEVDDVTYFKSRNECDHIFFSRTTVWLNDMHGWVICSQWCHNSKYAECVVNSPCKVDGGSASCVVVAPAAILELRVGWRNWRSTRGTGTDTRSRR